MSIALYDYQQDLQDRIFQAWADGHRNVCAVAPVGAGKTIIMASTAQRFGGSVCAIAHRQELVGQISLAFAQAGVRHGIIAPQSVIRTICQIHKLELGRHYFDPSSNIRVAGVGTLVRMSPDDRWLHQVALWMQDECFPAGTLVDGVPIEQIKVGDFVTAYNEATHSFERRKVTRLFKNSAPEDMVRVTVGHHVVNCTFGHPFFTRRGWVPAGLLRADDELLLHDVQRVWGELRHGATGVRKPIERKKAGVRFLFNVMRTCLHSEKNYRGGEVQTESGKAEATNGLRRVFDRILSLGVPSWQAIKRTAELLCAGVLQKSRGSDFVRNNGAHEQKVRIGAHEAKEPHAVGSDAAESCQNTARDRARPVNTWGKRKATDKGRSSTDGIVWPSWVYRAIHCANEMRAAFSQALQNRLCESCTEDSNRSGRVESQRFKPARARRKEGCVSTWKRLESVEIYKRGNFAQYGQGVSDGNVYNIEVEGLHTYIANGIVVHNCHHVVKQTQWAKAAEMMPNARGLGVTATPVRGDGKGLGRHADGIMDTMVVGPSLRDLIARGRLTDYRIFAPPAAALDLTVVPTSASGDYSPEPLRKAVHKAHLTGDVVKHYLRHCAGKRGVTFAVDIEAAAELARAYRDAGVPAECVSGKTPDLLRAQILHRFRTGELLQLTNCDLFGEGFNLPAIECVSMARPTQSFGLFVQQAGRALRTLEGKTQATIIDHVGNVQRHAVARFDQHAGKPVVDLCHRSWTLDRRERKSSSKAADGIPTRACPQCTQVYERAMPACPYCGHSPEPAARNDPILVDGDLTELDASTLRGMMSQVQRVDGMPLIPHGAPPEVEGAVRKRHRERQEAQRELRESMALWGGGHRVGQERRSQREFFLKFGTDVLTAQTLGAREARELTERVKRDMQ